MARWCSGSARGGYGARLKAKKISKKKPNKLIGFKKKLFFFWGWLGVQACITLNFFVSDYSKNFSLSLQKIIIMNKSDNVNGLYIKDGRLINNRPDGMSGIAHVASMKRSVDNDRKINMIAEGIQLAQNKKNFNQLEY